ncbi:MAG TPA: hypothetical protein PLR99_04125 [Polyangiaceae bacterium]|nr:hypothetical protein [Polyangiaceae bacterium]
MALLTYSLVRRHMKETSGFRPCDEGNSPPLALALAAGESAIGWYRNPAPWEGSILVFTSSAIWVVEGDAAERVALKDILGYESPGTKDGVSGLRVRTRDGFRFLRVAGSYGPYGKYKDFIGLMMVLRAVTNSGAVPE